MSKREQSSYGGSLRVAPVPIPVIVLGAVPRSVGATGRNKVFSGFGQGHIGFEPFDVTISKTDVDPTKVPSPVEIALQMAVSAGRRDSGRFCHSEGSFAWQVSDAGRSDHVRRWQNGLPRVHEQINQRWSLNSGGAQPRQYRRRSNRSRIGHNPSVSSILPVNGDIERRIGTLRL